MASLPAHESDLSRRRLLNWFLGTSLGALIVSIVYPVIRFVTPPRVAEASINEVEAGAVDDPVLMEKGFKIVRFGAEPVILVRTADARFYAYSATCTHLDCIVGFQKAHNRIWCNCHGGGYDLQGRNIIGPPPRPLTAYKVNLLAKGTGQQTVVISKA
ncbi:MAG TPA: ubiquinol-cytochrome c reductase iron-sulfur subunit [Thermoanaerobaculia bacterium]|nr:ubiquinol-cytochrome c reductase iron-sulfur subunit [Thermoanaerobaculia bacterium]